MKNNNKEVNEIAQALWDARREKAIVLCNIKVDKENSRFGSVKGTVEAINTTRNGKASYIIKTNKKTHIFQTVPLKNILTVRKDGKVVRK